MENIPIYIFNTEVIKEKNHNKCKTFFFLASGFKDLFILSKLNLKDVNIIYYDFNPYAIKFKKWLFKSWDGEKETLYNKIEKEEYSYSLSDLCYNSKEDFIKLSLKEQYNHCWKVELEKWKNAEHFQTAFKRIKKHKNKKFIHLDISRDFQKLSSLINGSIEPIYFWYSNCFDFEHHKVTPVAESHFLSVIEKTGKKVYCIEK